MVKTVHREMLVETRVDGGGSVPDTPPWLPDDAATYDIARRAVATRAAQRLLAGDLASAREIWRSALRLDGFGRPVIDAFGQGSQSSSTGSGVLDE